MHKTNNYESDIKKQLCYYLLSSQLIFEQLILQIKLLIKNKSNMKKTIYWIILYIFVYTIFL